MPPPLAAYLKTVVEEDLYGGRTMPECITSSNARFNDVLKAGTGGATSHSLRVSFISRCHRAGLSESQAMRLVNHSTSAVHKIYSRLNIDDARTAMAKVEPPPLAI